MSPPPAPAVHDVHRLPDELDVARPRLLLRPQLLAACPAAEEDAEEDGGGGEDAEHAGGGHDDRQHHQQGQGGSHALGQLRYRLEIEN